MALFDACAHTVGKTVRPILHASSTVLHACRIWSLWIMANLNYTMMPVDQLMQMQR
jgi:hypothetical protein